jgi:hypothetical protein
MGLTNQNNYEGTAPFIDNEQVDFRMAGDIAPAADVLRAREVREATALALQSYASDTNNVDETAPRTAQNPEVQYTQQAVAYIAAVSRNLAHVRQLTTDTNWNLEGDRLLPHFDLSNIFKKTLSLITGSDSRDSDALRMPRRGFLSGVSEGELLKAESAIGKTLFGEIPSGVSRDFFNLDATTWIWHQESTTDEGAVATTRYEVKDTGILKAQDGAQYSYVEGKELQDLTTAIAMYYDKVMPGIYKRDPQTGEKLTR